MGHGSAHGVFPTPLLGGVVGSMHTGDGAGLSRSCRHDCLLQRPNPLSFAGFVSDYVPHLCADPSILSSITGLGIRSAVDRCTFSGHDLDVRNPLLAGRTQPLERTNLPATGYEILNVLKINSAD